MCTEILEHIAKLKPHVPDSPDQDTPMPVEGGVIPLQPHQYPSPLNTPERETSDKDRYKKE